VDASIPIDSFPELSRIAFLRHGFTGRVAGLDVQVDRELALERLDQAHRQARTQMGFDPQSRMIFSQQVHGCQVAVVDAETPSPVAAVDGLITATPGIGLGIYVADCCGVFLVDPERRAIGLLHSGRKGTELGIATLAIEKMVAHFGCNPARMVAQLSPCIRPPHFETDFAAEIVRQCQQAGITQTFDSGRCTATLSKEYYSYRLERGKTGRMLAMLGMAPGNPPPS
jgi:polyphenol oxidase